MGHQGDPTQARGQVAGAEQPAGGHEGVGLTAGLGAWGAAGGLEEADQVWAGAGQADQAPAALVGGIDGGGRATADAAALPRGDPAARHGQEVGFVWLRSVLLS